VKDFIFNLIGLTAGVLFILALKGLSHPKTARRGNLLGALGAFVAIVLVFFQLEEIENLWWILGAIAFGLAVGVPAARKVQMTNMPQLVALFKHFFCTVFL
jgi:NAD(P) transhydrogenase subunit beta